MKEEDKWKQRRQTNKRKRKRNVKGEHIRNERPREVTSKERKEKKETIMVEKEDEDEGKADNLAFCSGSKYRREVDG